MTNLSADDIIALGRWHFIQFKDEATAHQAMEKYRRYVERQRDSEPEAEAYDGPVDGPRPVRRRGTASRLGQFRLVNPPATPIIVGSARRGWCLDGSSTFPPRVLDGSRAGRFCRDVYRGSSCEWVDANSSPLPDCI
jgi:hypothetical protein